MTNPNVQYQFGLKIGDRELHLGGDKIFVETQMEKWLSLFEGKIPEDVTAEFSPSVGSASPSPRVPGQTGTVPSQRKLPSIGEFIKTKGPKEVADMILVIGLYMERFQQKNLFTRSDLLKTQIFAKLGKTEEDVQKTLVELVEKNLLSETATMGSSEMGYALTFSGEQLVKEGFTG